MEGVSLYLFVLVISEDLFGQTDLETFLAVEFKDEEEKE